MIQYKIDKAIHIEFIYSMFITLALIFMTIN